jgi:hypothetical protein
MFPATGSKRPKSEEITINNIHNLPPIGGTTQRLTDQDNYYTEREKITVVGGKKWLTSDNFMFRMAKNEDFQKSQ